MMGRKHLITGLLAAAVSALPAHGAPARPSSRNCGAADREALLVGAIHHEVQDTLYEAQVYSKPADCVAISVGDGQAEADPPNKVMLRLHRIARTRVVLLRDRAKCKAAVTTWVAEPRCSGSGAYVRTRNNDHCPIPYRKVGDRWETQPGACE
jgi:hypothetical protein